VQRTKQDPVVTEKNVFGAVAMMTIEIEDGDTVQVPVVVQHVGHRDGDVVVITESHDSVASGMMSRRSHHREGALTSHGMLRRLDGAAGGQPRYRIDVVMARRVGVHVITRPDRIEVGLVVDAQQIIVGTWDGLQPGVRGISA
jgi:hypothetical protein